MSEQTCYYCSGNVEKDENGDHFKCCDVYVHHDCMRKNGLVLDDRRRTQVRCPDCGTEYDAQPPFA